MEERDTRQKDKFENVLRSQDAEHRRGRKSKLYVVPPISAPWRQSVCHLWRSFVPRKDQVKLNAVQKIVLKGSTEFQDLGAEEEVLFTSREIAVDWKAPEGWWWASWRLENVLKMSSYCLMYLNSSAWLRHMMIMLSWDPEFHSAAHPSHYYRLP